MKYLLFPLTVLLAGCSPTLSVHMFNVSGRYQTVGDGGMGELAAGATTLNDSVDPELALPEFGKFVAP